MGAIQLVAAAFVVAVVILTVTSFFRGGESGLQHPAPGSADLLGSLVDIHAHRKASPPCSTQFDAGLGQQHHVQDLGRLAHAVVRGECPFLDLDRLASPVVIDMDAIPALYGGPTPAYECRQDGVPETPLSRRAGRKDFDIAFPPTGTFVGCLMLPPSRTLHVRIQADTFDASTSLRVDDTGCADPLGSQELSCRLDPDSAIVSYENLHDVPRRACFYVTAELDGVGCRDAPEACERKFQLAWVAAAAAHCEMKVTPGFNAIHSVVASAAPYQKVLFPAECEAICVSEPACDLAVWHEASVNRVWGNVCVTLSREQVVDFGRLAPESWVEQPEVVTMVKVCGGPAQGV